MKATCIKCLKQYEVKNITSLKNICDKCLSEDSTFEHLKNMFEKMANIKM